jgi:hypothetical protein
MENINNPKEFQCLGFNLTTMDVSIHKGYIQLNAAYKNVTEPNRHFCDVFDRMMRLGPIS